MPKSAVGPSPSRFKTWRSGATTRPQRETLIAAARRREVDCVLVWRLDRWGRSLLDLVNTLQELTALEVGIRLPVRSTRPDNPKRAERWPVCWPCLRSSSGIFCGTA